MLIKDFIFEDFVNYKLPSAYIVFPHCSFKCGKENCQNWNKYNHSNLNLSVGQLCSYYLNNEITKAIVCGGFEPFDSSEDLLDFVSTLRTFYQCDDDIVIYSGYTEEELKDEKVFLELQKYKNIIVKFGRYIPNQKSHYDEILGIKLSSDNQYAKVISNDKI